MTKTIEDLFVYLRLSTDAIIILLFVYLARNYKVPQKFFIILAYCCFDLIFNLLIDQINWSLRFVEISYTFYTLLEYFLFTWFLLLNVKSQSFKNVMLLLSMAFLVFMVSYTFTVENQNLDSIPIGIETILILIYSFYFFFEEMNNVDNLFIYSKPEFWIITGFLIYLAGSFFIYVFANQVDYKILVQYWFLTNVFFIFQSILFAIGLMTFLKKEKNISSSKKIRPYLN